jgi:hypothetical protein
LRVLVRRHAQLDPAECGHHAERDERPVDAPPASSAREERLDRDRCEELGDEPT